MWNDSVCSEERSVAVSYEQSNEHFSSAGGKFLEYALVYLVFDN
jgi:hypothetical protein